MKTRLGPLICYVLPFLHAINGCDTTSRLFGVAKGSPLKKIKNDADFKTAAETLCTKGKTTADIIASGEKALISVYGGRAGDTLDMLRYKRFWEKVTSSITTVQVRSLSPTSAAAKYHSLRVYLQVRTGSMYNGCSRASVEDDPVQLCKSDCRSKRCTCRKYGLRGSLACGECKGIGCLNSPSPEPLADCDD
ncbi:hypothetical protein PoB_000678500 [Plakobranchus ocellatus]|uniref:Uncharacterized protein n=1 Tax=Plakobranchus ocellatus TaxID=259542 RepID=A0AAV3YBZ6_9GAST|nr:hypothetical protein PoB_000678500 [Plakobranchus ocellatus]